MVLKVKGGRVLREEFRRFLVRSTNCALQEVERKHGKGGRVVREGWPCGTCTFWLFRRMGLNPSAKFYHEHNKKCDRGNEVWRAVLQIRDAKLR